MFFKQPEESAGQNVPPNEELIFDVSTTDFEARVMHASMEKPVIVDFWAPWCGPCKQLMPILEDAIKAAGGDVLLAKVNLDDNPELAQAMRVQSVPTVFAFFAGQPIDGFQGAQPPAQIQAFIDRAIQTARQAKPGALDIPEALKAAAQALADNDLNTAQGIYGQILGQDEKNVAAYIGLVRTFIAAGILDQAKSIVENAPEEIIKDPKFEEAKTALELALNAPSGDLSALENAVAKNPDDQQAKIDLAEAQFAAGQKEEAIETLLESISQDREWNEELARKTLLNFFKALGGSDPLAIKARKKLSSILFS